MARVNLEWWQSRRVVVTGHTGFVGSWLSIALLQLGAKVTGISNHIPTHPSLFEVTNLASRIIDIRADVREASSIVEVLEKHKPAVIFHLAAQPLVKESYVIPRETYETNVMGTVNLLDALRRVTHPVVLINMTSDKCYENVGSSVGYKEHDALGGRDPYSSSKACSELITRAYRDSFFSPEVSSSPAIGIASIRAGNIIGGGDWAPHRLIPDFIRAYENGDDLKVRYPNATRPWQHVLDVVNAMFLLAQQVSSEPLNFCEAWNIGPDQTNQWSVEKVLSHMMKLLGGGNCWLVDEDTKNHEEILLALDNQKARQQLGWTPAWDTEHSLRETVLWYRAYLHNSANVSDFTNEQVKEFFLTQNQ